MPTLRTTRHLSREAAAVEKGLLFRGRGAAEDDVAVGEAPEAPDDGGMLLGVSGEFLVAVAARHRERPFLVGQVFGVRERQVEKAALAMRQLPVEAAGAGALGDGAGEPSAA